jgi:hypothetical protein
VEEARSSQGIRFSIFSSHLPPARAYRAFVLRLGRPRSAAGRCPVQWKQPLFESPCSSAIGARSRFLSWASVVLAAVRLALLWSLSCGLCYVVAVADCAASRIRIPILFLAHEVFNEICERC